MEGTECKAGSCRVGTTFFLFATVIPTVTYLNGQHYSVVEKIGSAEKKTQREIEIEMGWGGAERLFFLFFFFSFFHMHIERN